MFEPIRKTLKDREMMRTIFSLAGPTVMENALQTIVSYADTAQVGAIGAQASASVGLTATMLWLIQAQRTWTAQSARSYSRCFLC